jgi:hypothetical protein
MGRREQLSRLCIMPNKELVLTVSESVISAHMFHCACALQNYFSGNKWLKWCAKGFHQE